MSVTREFLISKVLGWANRQPKQNLLLALRFMRNIDSGNVAIPDGLDEDEEALSHAI